jgi:hypothetical protein
MKRAETFGGPEIQVAVRSGARPADEGEGSRTAAWYWSVALAVAVWSVSYLVRQPGVAATTLVPPFSPFGDFALEGMLLALAWLGVLLAACLVLLTGAARIQEP